MKYQGNNLIIGNDRKPTDALPMVKRTHEENYETEAFLKGKAFSAKKVTDTPTDNLQVVNRAYVTANGLITERPTSPVIGQFFFNATTSTPLWFSGIAWTNSVGSVVASA